MGHQPHRVIFYGLTLTAVSLTITALWRSVLSDRRLLKPELGEKEISAVTRATAPNIGLLLGATALAIPYPRGAAFMYLVIAVIAVFRARADETVGEAETGRRGAPADRPDVRE